MINKCILLSFADHDFVLQHPLSYLQQNNLKPKQLSLLKVYCSLKTILSRSKLFSAVAEFCASLVIRLFLTPSYTGFFGLAGHGGGGGGVGIHHTFITLVLFDGFELNLVQ